MLVGLQRRLIYLPFPAQVPRAVDVVPSAGEVTLRTVDGLALGAWLVPAGEPDRGVGSECDPSPALPRDVLRKEVAGIPSEVADPTRCSPVCEALKRANVR